MDAYNTTRLELAFILVHCYLFNIKNMPLTYFLRLLCFCLLQCFVPWKRSFLCDPFQIFFIFCFWRLSAIYMPQITLTTCWTGGQWTIQAGHPITFSPQPIWQKTFHSIWMLFFGGYGIKDYGIKDPTTTPPISNFLTHLLLTHFSHSNHSPLQLEPAIDRCLALDAYVSVTYIYNTCHY